MNNNLVAMDFANYLIWSAKEKFNKGITNLQLQKFLYFAYVKYLIRNNEKLFNDPIEKWQYGPVVPSVYHSFKDYGFFEINEPKQEFDVNFIDGKLHLNEKKFDPSVIDSDHKLSSILNDVLVKWINLPAFKMVEETHKEPMWKNYQTQIMNGERGLQYTDDEIKRFFLKNNSDLPF
ncbi:DUF4065 domain-containing protein [Acinetobacter baumannii]|uniref:Panacea domain-containing protein n=1 Tax=Acinetobacter baumannii TaxID=470 RepID=UPI000FEC2B0A|nr:type II toxin-antitoxin system antitoxin SocA domain-containing protein [Acinetobacter baumannii]QAB40095.1 DUF4065 domain-containing protein [Acinetobacter baumannii]